MDLPRRLGHGSGDALATWSPVVSRTCPRSLINKDIPRRLHLFVFTHEHYNLQLRSRGCSDDPNRRRLPIVRSDQGAEAFRVSWPHRALRNGHRGVVGADHAAPRARHRGAPVPAGDEPQPRGEGRVQLCFPRSQKQKPKDFASALSANQTLSRSENPTYPAKPRI
jgi:hypothetical protein